jgi:hypothetical protein
VLTKYLIASYNVNIQERERKHPKPKVNQKFQKIKPLKCGHTQRAKVKTLSKI